MISPNSAPETRLKWFERLLVAGSIVTIAWFYLWTVSPSGFDTLVSKDDSGSYYNLLARGLLKGELSLDTPADPALATSANPYDPVLRGPHGLHDASYYRGKYYIYFGITPVLVLFLPFHVLTGHYVVDHTAVMLFALGGFLLSWWLVRAVIRAHFPRTPFLVQLTCLWVLGLGNLVPLLLRRAAMWEVPIACGYLLFVLTAWCVWRAMHGPARLRWIIAGSVAMGLAVGARPTYLPGSVILLAPLVRAMGGGGWWRRRAWWGQAVGTVLPIAMIGAGLALYNYARFGSPFEFGDRYQMAGTNQLAIRHFNVALIPTNVWIYFCSAAGLSPYFPFLAVINPPASAAGQVTIENPYGLIPNMPWVLFALPAVILAIRRRDVLGGWVLGVTAAVALITSLLCCFIGVAGRYQVDFTPGIVLVAAVGVLGLIDASSGPWRRWLALAAIALGIWTCAFNYFVSMQHNRLLAVNHPARYARVAHFFNHGPHWLAKLGGHQDGPVEIRLIFPKDKRDKIEPLVVTGHQFVADYLFVHYLAPGLIRFGLEHTSRGSWIGPATRIDPEADHTVVVQMGSLYPPAAHPAHDGLPATEIDVRTRSVKVLLDGRTVLQALVDCYDATDWQPSIGTSGPHRPGFKDDFSGRILGWRRVAALPADFGENKTGKLHLLIRLPTFTRPRSEPLLSTGEPGKGDLIYIRYLDETHYQIGHDHWSYGGTLAPVIGYDPNVPIDLDITCPPLMDEGTPPRLVIALNGTPLIDEPARYYPSRPTQIAVGRNLIGASTAEAAFTGVIEIQERVAK